MRIHVKIQRVFMRIHGQFMRIHVLTQRLFTKIHGQFMRIHVKIQRVFMRIHVKTMSSKRATAVTLLYKMRLLLQHICRISGRHSPVSRQPFSLNYSSQRLNLLTSPSKPSSSSSPSPPLWELPSIPRLTCNTDAFNTDSVSSVSGLIYCFLIFFFE